MKLRLPVVFLVLASLLLSAEARAWNKPGHMVTGVIAFNVLQESNPEVVQKVIAVLKSNPFFRSRWEPTMNRLGLTGEDRDRFLFVFAARWPDDARGTSFHREFAHFINFPFKPSDEPESVKPKDPLPDNILARFKENVATFRDSQTSKRNRAIALSWIFHLVGDVHQPLHTTALFSTVFKDGDRGGTAWIIKVRPDAGGISLHTFWDGLVFGPDDFRGVLQRAILLRANPNFTRAKLSELSEKDFEKWANPESFDLAVQFAYRNGELPG